MMENKNFDVLIIGGSYAGLSAAMALGRSLRKVLIIDNDLPCNRQTPHSQNFITHDGEKPAEITRLAKQQLEKYETVKFHDGLAIKGKKTAKGFEIETHSGEIFTARKVIFATGIKDIMLDIPGFADCWGISVIHCPYCHGYEYRQQKTAILANGEAAMHYAKLVSNLTTKLSILTNGNSDFTDEQIKKLQNHQIQIIETAITEIVHQKGMLQYVVFADGNQLEIDALYAKVPFTQHSDMPFSLGCEITEEGYIKTDGFQKTNISGIYACGDNTSMMRSVANAVSSGNFTGAMVNKDLTEEDF